jgi:hypothetical protein
VLELVELVLVLVELVLVLVLVDLVLVLVELVLALVELMLVLLVLLAVVAVVAMKAHCFYANKRTKAGDIFILFSFQNKSINLHVILRF